MKLDHQVSKELGAGAKEELIPGEEQVNFEKLVVGPLKNIAIEVFLPMECDF